MSIDAMYWVWQHSQSKGTGRHVMLACANWITGADGTVRASTADLARFANAARSSVIKAIDGLVKSGELELLEEGRGTRAALYRIPGAVGYRRPLRSSGPESGPLENGQGSENETPSSSQGSENRTPNENARGPETGPQGSENRTSRGPETGPHYQYQQTKPVESSRSAREDAADFPDEVLPLVHGLTASGLTVRWPWTGSQWFPIIALIRRSGVPALIDYAHRAASSSSTPVQSAKYFLPGWRELPPAPPEDTPDHRPARPPLRAVAGGWQPYTNPTDQSVYENGWT